MAKLDLMLRDLKTGETVNAMFESEDDARVWLEDRPRFTQVLGVATHGLPDEVYRMLRTAVRPLDDEETALNRAIEARAEADERAREEAESRLAEAEMAAHREAMRRADPERPMAITWELDGEMRLADAADPREITPEARAAVLAWIRERDGWVADRGQVVGEAQLAVWPGRLPPDAGGERVLPGGRFSPVSGPAK
jgi:hypothetical protein